MDIGSIQIDSKPAGPPNNAHPTIGSNKVLPSPFLKPSAPVITEQQILNNQATQPKDDDECCDPRTKSNICCILECIACIVCCLIMCLSLLAKD